MGSIPTDAVLPLKPGEFHELQAAAAASGKDLATYLLDLHRGSLNGKHVALPAPDKAFRKIHSTPLGRIIQGDSRHVMQTQIEQESVSLIMTSPPYALVWTTWRLNSIEYQRCKPWAFSSKARSRLSDSQLLTCPPAGVHSRSWSTVRSRLTVFVNAR